MSVRAMTWAWAQSMPPAAKLVLMALADHAHEDGGGARPSVNLLARKTGYSERQIQRILSELIRLGVISVQHPPMSKPNRATTYRLHVQLEVIIQRDEWAARSAPPELRFALIERDEMVCQHCGDEGDEDTGPDGFTWEADRVVPGDLYDLATCVLSCRTCNRAKGGRFSAGGDKMSGQDVAPSGRQRSRGRGVNRDARILTEPKTISYESAYAESEQPNRVIPLPKRQRKPKSARRMEVPENSPTETAGRTIGMPHATDRSKRIANERAAVARPDSGGGLSRYFGILASQAGLAGPQQVNGAALAKNLTSWMSDGQNPDTPAVIRAMMEQFFASPKPRSDRPLWRRFLAEAPALRVAHAKAQPIDYRAAESRFQEQVKRDAARGDVRAQQELSGENRPWRNQREA